MYLLAFDCFVASPRSQNVGCLLTHLVLGRSLTLLEVLKTHISDRNRGGVRYGRSEERFRGIETEGQGTDIICTDSTLRSDVVDEYFGYLG